MSMPMLTKLAHASMLITAMTPFAATAEEFRVMMLIECCYG